MNYSHTLKEYAGKPCPYCNRSMSLDVRTLMPTRDHYPIPKSLGGRRIIICCYICNHMKGDMHADAWAIFMLENKGGWFATRLPDATLPAFPAEPHVSIPSKPLPIEHTRYILQHGTRAFRAWQAEGFPDIAAKSVCPAIASVADFFAVQRYPYLKRWRKIA